MLSTKLQTVLAVAEYKNFTRAAEELNMTQPAVSHHIKQLEQEVGAPLFVRNKAGLKLTAQGEIWWILPGLRFQREYIRFPCIMKRIRI